MFIAVKRWLKERLNLEISPEKSKITNAKMQSNGEIYEKAAEISKANGMHAPKAIVLIAVEEIHSLKPGPTAGKKISLIY